MYQAIVFLPLLGAIMAGLIALAGARARWPGEALRRARNMVPSIMAPHHAHALMRSAWRCRCHPQLAS